MAVEALATNRLGRSWGLLSRSRALFRIATSASSSRMRLLAAVSSACSARFEAGSWPVPIRSCSSQLSDGPVAVAQIGRDLGNGTAGGQLGRAPRDGTLRGYRVGTHTAPSADVVTQSQANRLQTTGAHQSLHDFQGDSLWYLWGEEGSTCRQTISRCRRMIWMRWENRSLSLRNAQRSPQIRRLRTRQRPISVQVAYRLSVRMAVLGTHSKNIAALTNAAGALVQSNAEIYASQEQQNAAAMQTGASSPTAASVPQAPPVPWPLCPHLPVPSIGSPPSSGKEIAQFAHAGPGPSVLHDAADRLARHRTDLDDTATALQRHATALTAAWRAASADKAQAAILSLAARHGTSAEVATALVEDITSHAQRFARLRHDVPTPGRIR